MKMALSGIHSIPTAISEIHGNVLKADFTIFQVVRPTDQETTSTEKTSLSLTTSKRKEPDTSFRAMQGSIRVHQGAKGTRGKGWVRALLCLPLEKQGRTG